MATVLAVYAVACGAVSAYAAWLAIGSGRLSRRLEQLEKPVDSKPVNLSAIRIA